MDAKNTPNAPQGERDAALERVRKAQAALGGAMMSGRAATDEENQTLQGLRAELEAATQELQRLGGDPSKASEAAKADFVQRAKTPR